MMIGVLGAGQLGRMLALLGYPLGFKFSFFDTVADAPAGQIAELMVGDYADEAALKAFAKNVDVITYEFENVPVKAVEFLQTLCPVYPSVKALEVAQDRLHEKTFLQNLGIPTPRFIDVQSQDDLYTEFPSVLKTRRMGYDGKGQAVLKSRLDADKAWSEMKGQRLILEGFVPFEREVSVIAVRSQKGDIKIYPLTENVHREGILRTSIAPAVISEGLQTQAETYMQKVLQALDYVGVLAIEFFVLNHQLIANEMAPRVHNSGHWTIEGAETSQFENHMRAVAGLPLGEVSSRGFSSMLNLIGVKPEFEKILEIPNTHLHWYGKSVKPNRKVGHVTVRAESREEVLEGMARVETFIRSLEV
jgi:5-(carboxyamino)imidazole ribonucleotide synthase